jgi:hypothetical protein
MLTAVMYGVKFLNSQCHTRYSANRLRVLFILRLCCEVSQARGYIINYTGREDEIFSVV